jgi:hypothetical protein
MFVVESGWPDLGPRQSDGIRPRFQGTRASSRPPSDSLRMVDGRIGLFCIQYWRECVVLQLSSAKVGELLASSTSLMEPIVSVLIWMIS